MSTVDPDIVRIAERRLHLVTDGELQRLGLSPRTIRRWVESGSLHRVIPGVLSTTAGPYDVSQRELALCLVDTGGRAVAPQRGRVLGDPPGTEGPCGRHGAPRPLGRRSAGRRPLQQPDARAPRRRPRRRGASDVGARDRVRSGRCPRRGQPPVGDRRRAAPRALHRRRDRRGVPRVVRSRAARVCRVAAAGACSPSVPVARRCRSSSSVPGGARRGRAPAGRAATPGRVAQRTHRLSRPGLSGLRVDIEVDHTEWHSTSSAVERDKTRDLGLALLGWERLRFTERAVERRLRCASRRSAPVLDLRLPRDPPSRLIVAGFLNSLVKRSGSDRLTE